MQIALIILAAGGSTRLGRPKQLLPYKDGNLLRHSVETALASRCRPIVVVLGSHADDCLDTIADLPIRATINDQWEAGLGTSIAAGLELLEKDRGNPDAALLMLCDQPHLTAEHLNRLVETHLGGAEIAASEYEGSAGVPALFARSFFNELASLDPAHGAKPLIAKYADRVAYIPFPEGRVDIDTPADYDRLTRPE
jgi:molybdenum cofactor cytidylyltransferase